VIGRLLRGKASSPNKKTGPFGRWRRFFRQLRARHLLAPNGALKNSTFMTEMEPLSSMNMSTLAKYAAGVTLAAAMLAGCSGSQSGVSPAGSNAMVPNTHMSGIAQTLAAVKSLGKAVHPDTRQSWMSPDKKKHKKKLNLLYISDSGTDDVDVYNYPSGSTYGQLTGFEEPQGECSNGKDVWIANTEDSEIEEYAAGGTTPIATLSDSGQYPVGCSWDPTTGNLAVSNIISTSDGDGNLAIYKGAAGTPTTYTCSSLAKYYFVGYDAKGDVYVDGEDTLSDGGFALCGLASGGSSLSTVTLNQSVEFPGQVQWDGKYVAVGDQDEATLYQFTISGSSGTKEGSTPLDESSDCVQVWIDGSTVICPDYPNADVKLYAYPAGGDPTSEITSGLSEPIGSAVAKAKAKKK
jgi:hypothetical protein